MNILIFRVLPFLTALFVTVTPTWAILLDFEEGCGTSPAPAGCIAIVSTPGYYPDVEFARSSQGTNIVSQLGAPAPPFSPSRSAQWDSTQTLPDDPFRANFIAHLVHEVSVVLGDSGGDPDHLFLEAFDRDGQLIDRDIKTLSSNFRGGFILTVKAQDIAHVEFGRVIERPGDGNSILFDNFSFSAKPPSTGAPIPEPSTLLLIGTGMISLSIWKHRTLNNPRTTN